MPGIVCSQPADGDRAAGRRVARRSAAVLLVVVLAAGGCGGDESDTASDDLGGQAQDVGSLPEDGDAQEPESGEAQDSSEDAQDSAAPVVPLWPHCTEYSAVLAAAEVSSGDVWGFESAADAAVASAEALAADASADNEARDAGRRAVEVFAAANDAALFAAYGETAVALGTPAYSAAYESALAAAWGEAGTGRVTAEARVAAAESAVGEASALAEQAPIDLETASEAADDAVARASEAEAVAYADAEAAAAAVLSAADLDASALEAVAVISAAVGEAYDYGGDVALQAARAAAYDDASRSMRHHDESLGIEGRWSKSAAGWIAGIAARDASYTATAALVTRLDVLAESAGLGADLTAAHQSAMSAWAAGWALAEDVDWRRSYDDGSSGAWRPYFVDEFDRAAEQVFDRQAVYDDFAYRAAARAVRTAVAASVPSSESVAAAEAEDAHWAEGGTAHRAFTAAQNQIAAARARQKGKIHPGTADSIAWDAYHVAVDILESGALAEASDIRADAASRAVIDIEADARVVDARADVERTEAAVADAQDAVAQAEDALWAAESELAEAQSALDAARPSHDRAARAAWKAVAAQAGCG